MKIAVIGATGLVGRTMLKILQERIPVSERTSIHIIAAASEKSKGSKIVLDDRILEVLTLEEALAEKPDIALFSAGGTVSREWAPRFAGQACTVIDNSSAWRREPEVPLVVPEVNGDILHPSHKIIANPNCSTIQLVMVLAPLQQAYGLERVVVSTYQSVTGAGNTGVAQLEAERKGESYAKAFPHAIDLNIIPEGGYFLDNGYTSEEDKLDFESRKILRQDDLKVTATVVRVPVMGGHSESVNISLKKSFELGEVKALLHSFPGIHVMDDPSHHLYPMPIIAEGRDEVFVGRIRRDLTIDNGLNLWIVSDNLRKGAATNAVQIALRLLQEA